MLRKARKNDSQVKQKCAKYAKLEELVLPHSKLKFCSEQLQNLNFILDNKLSKNIDLTTEKSVFLARSVTERLIQRLLCGVGMLDSRFATKFLVTLHNTKSTNSSIQKLEYLVRLDSLSTPSLYETEQVSKYTIIERDLEYPVGYARLRLHTSSLKIWGEYANSGGYLRRDRIQARMVELLAQAAAEDKPNSPLQVDESWLCGSPGKIMDAICLHRILHIPAENHLFYGPGSNVPRFPDPRDFRLAIVDEPNGIRLRVEFLSPTLSAISIEVRLLIGIGVDAWPASSDFPFRVPLGHVDCLLYHKAAQTGMYLVGYGVQSSAWQMRFPAAENVLLNHYGPNSTITTILDVLYYILEEINMFCSYKRQQICYKILNRYILQTALFYELEKDTACSSVILLKWSPMYFSIHILQILDKLIAALRDQNYPNYFFPNANLLINPGHLCEDDFLLEANKIQSYLVKCFDESLMSMKGNECFKRIMTTQDTEMILLNKWKELIDGLLPPSGTRGRRFCFAGSKTKMDVACSQYTSRQLEYIGLVLKNMLSVKQNILQQTDESQWEEHLANHTNLSENHLEDVIYLLVSIMEQARDQYLENPNSTVKNKNKMRIFFDLSSTKVVDLVRRDKEINSLDFEDDTVLVKTILKWLYKALDQNKRYLAPILKPYLNCLFVTSHIASWHLEAIKQTYNNDELDALGTFAKLVNLGRMSPAEGLIDAINKKWIWAKGMLKHIEEGSLRVVFVPERGKLFRHLLSLPTNNKKETVDGSKTLNHSKSDCRIQRQMTLPNSSYFNTIIKHDNSNEEVIKPQHDILKESSPLTLILKSIHRRGDHRCCGDILQALLSMQRINLLQEVSSHLPNEERIELLETIHQITSERCKKNITKTWSNTLPQLSKNKINSKYVNVEKYTPKEESAGIRITKMEEGFRMKKWDKTKSCQNLEKNSETLIGSCRAARIREDNNFLNYQDNFKIKSLLRSKESFRS